MDSPSPSGEGLGWVMGQDRRLLDRAARMRHDATPFEAMLWRQLSRFQPGHKFRRQHVVGARIVDFFCPAKAFAVKVDGDTHNAQAIADRNAYFTALGVIVLHVGNQDIANNMDGVLAGIVAMLDSLPDRWPHPNPSPEGEGLGPKTS